jgi:hypothetical protein
MPCIRNMSETHMQEAAAVAARLGITCFGSQQSRQWSSGIRLKQQARRQWDRAAAAAAALGAAGTQARLGRLLLGIGPTVPNFGRLGPLKLSE